MSRRVEQDPELAAAAMSDACALLLGGGCTTTIDSTTDGTSAEVFQRHGIRHFLFHEVVGLTQDRAEVTLSAALADRKDGSLCVGHGINPHAPYSVGPYLRMRLRQMLKEKTDLLCAWHLAESTDEVKLFSSATGPMVEFLQSLGLPLPFTEAVAGGKGSTTPQEFLMQEGLYERCDYAFHLNHPVREDFAQFRFPHAVVHCPGTHQYFNRPDFPMLALLEAGVNVCLGTDSLASSGSLSMLEALQSCARQWPELNQKQLLDLVTLNPARTRIFGNVPAAFGILKHGATADFTVLRSHPTSGHEIKEQLLSPETAVSATVVAGLPRYQLA
jgi:cytosine/adenosine deaminase-related metal-dependent hydrolase